jgi:hypothetical protein
LSAAFLVLCVKSPTGALNRREGRALADRLTRRKLGKKDPLPDESWRTRVTEVIEVAADDSTLWDWLENIAATTHGAVYSKAAKEFPFIDEAEATARAKQLLADSAYATLLKWIRAVSPDRYNHGSRRWTTIEAIDNVVRPVLERAVKATVPKLAAADVCNLAIALHEIYDDDAKLADLVLATARNAPKHKAAQRAAAAIIEARAIAADDTARPPTTTKALQALFEGVAALDQSATRRYERFIVYERERIVQMALTAIEAGYDPQPDVIACVLAALPIARLSAAERTRLVDNAAETALAQALRDAVRAHRDAAGQRAADFSHARFEEYERYRNDPLVATPRSRGDDIAMFRGLNDALYGPGRDRPRLSPRIVALICDRRLDEAHAAYVEEVGEANAEAAIRDAAEYFAPDID